MSWQLWSNDYFDREAAPMLEAEGEDFISGCAALWEQTLEEGILDDGHPSFTSFQLRCESGAIFLPRDPFSNPELARLRQWRKHPQLIALLAQTLAEGIHKNPDQAQSILNTAASAADAEDFCRKLKDGD